MNLYDVLDSFVDDTAAKIVQLAEEGAFQDSAFAQDEIAKILKNGLVDLAPTLVKTHLSVMGKRAAGKKKIRGDRSYYARIGKMGGRRPKGARQW